MVYREERPAEPKVRSKEADEIIATAQDSVAKLRETARNNYNSASETADHHAQLAAAWRQSAELWARLAGEEV